MNDCVDGAVKLRFRAYLDPKTGNEFVIFAPGHVVDPRREGWNSASDVILCSMSWHITMCVKISPREWIEAEVDGDDILLPHVAVDITSPKLKHGACTAWLVGGPIFDEVKASEAEAA